MLHSASILPASARTAILTDEATVDYRALSARIEQAARAILAAVPHARESRDLNEARVAFLVPPGVLYAVIVRAIWRAGGVAVPLATSHPPAELSYVIRDADAALVISDETRAADVAPVADAAGVPHRTTTQLVGAREDHVGRHSQESTQVLPAVAASRRALILYTSGTTGKPKGVVTTHANLDAQVGALLSAWEWSAADRLLLVLPLHHVHGLINGLTCALAAGATCEMAAQFDADHVWTRLASGEVTVFTAVPTIYQRLIRAWDAAPEVRRRGWSEGVRSLRLMMCGSAALPVTMLEQWRAISGHTLLERYGMTELGMALSNPLHGSRRPGHVGQPLPAVEVQIVDEAGVTVDAGTSGELEVRGPNVFLEYWRRASDTTAAFRNGWFRTGDVAVLADGAYRLLGRTSVDIIKTGGYKVSALEIEEELRAHPAVAECAVLGMPDDEWGERVAAVVELRPGAAIALDNLQAWLRPRLAPYKIPRALHVVPALPRNAMGKVIKPEVKRMIDVK